MDGTEEGSRDAGSAQQRGDELLPESRLAGELPSKEAAGQNGQKGQMGQTVGQPPAEAGDSLLQGAQRQPHAMSDNLNNFSLSESKKSPETQKNASALPSESQQKREKPRQAAEGGELDDRLIQNEVDDFKFSISDRFMNIDGNGSCSNQKQLTQSPFMPSDNKSAKDDQRLAQDARSPDSGAGQAGQ